jgi:hypothetical protein
MNPKFCRNTGDGADPKLMLPTKLLEYFHFGFPVHEWFLDRAEETLRSTMEVGQNSPSLLAKIQ